MYTQEWKGESAFFLSYFFFRASPYGWICGVISTKTPASIILCLNILLYQRNLRHWRNAAEWINGKVYKLLPKIRASLVLMCYVIWLHCFGAEGGQKAVGMCSEKSCLQDHESICNVCFNAFQTVMGQNYSSNRIYIWTMMQFYCKDPEFVQIICFEIALQESYWPLASDLTCEWKGRDAHWKIDPLKRMCKTWLLNKSYTNCAKPMCEHRILTSCNTVLR